MRARPLALVGPTAAGKTAAALEIAEALGAEIVSVDSMLVYRGMDIGTAKPTAAERARVPHHLIDLVDPSESFSVERYQRLGREVLAEIAARRRPALLVGGSGLYYRALVDDLTFPGTDDATRRSLEREAELVGPAGLYGRLRDLDPAAADKIEPGNVRRTVRALEVAAVTGSAFSSFASAWERYPSQRVHAAGLRPEPGAERLRVRIEAMLAAGWLDEVRGLMRAGFGGWLTATQAIGYAELVRHLEGALSLQDTVGQIVRRTKNLARRQMAWFRRDPRIRWFPAEGADPAASHAALLDYLKAGA